LYETIGDLERDLVGVHGAVAAQTSEGAGDGVPPDGRCLCRIHVGDGVGCEQFLQEMQVSFANGCEEAVCDVVALSPLRFDGRLRGVHDALDATQKTLAGGFG
jgi:hypothetical protein